ncbi:MAG: aldo/keto reductase [Gammaproteobacteria bacterium]|nr:aldo/keto reductase [Gammaproteobacteria bacterium]
MTTLDTDTSVTLNVIGSTHLRVPAVCFGTSAIGSMPATYGYPVTEPQAVETLMGVLGSTAPFLDTSRNYGDGKSEARIGLALKELGGLPKGAVISTKLDRDMATGRFDAGRARQSLEESLAAMGIERVQLLFLHDPEHSASLDEIVNSGGAMDELIKMKEEGLATAIGLAAGDVEMMLPVLKDFELDAVITHNRYTLLNRNAQPLLDLAAEKNLAVLNAAPYGSGVLVQGSSACPRYAYQQADEQLLERVRAIEVIADKYKVPLGAIALQFSMRHPVIASTICGITKRERIAQTIEWSSLELPESLWSDIEKLPFGMSNPEANRAYSHG